MKQLRIFLVGLLCALSLSLAGAAPADVTIAQISDTHLGERHSPQADANLRRIVEMVNAAHPDAVILSGDIGETEADRERAKTILKKLAAPIYYVPGNHEFHDADGLKQYRKQFGPDYYRFQVRNVEVLALDSQLVGNYERFDAKTASPLSSAMKAESEKMFAWLARQQEPTRGKVVIAVQHIPLFRDGNFPDAKPYWTVNAPYAQREMDWLHRLGVKHLLAGHWHTARIFEHNGITIHVAPATSWRPFGGKLGFALHHLDADGDVHTEILSLPDAAH